MNLKRILTSLVLTTLVAAGLIAVPTPAL